MSDMIDTERVKNMYVTKDTLSTRIMLHQKYSTNPYGWANWVFDQYDFKARMRVLELGSGTGIIWKDHLGQLPKHIKIVLSDYSPLMVNKLRELLSDDTRFSFEQIDIQNIPYPTDTFDVVIANHMLYHVPDIQRSLSEASRVLKPNGRFHATTTGENTYPELQTLYRLFDGRAEFSQPKNISFTLENGEAQLKPHFSSIEQRQYIDSLAVTNPDDLIAYITSYNSIPEALMAEFRTAVLNQFDPTGTFRIRKDQGMFLCTKPPRA